MFFVKKKCHFQLKQLCLSNTWCHSLFYQSIFCKLSVKLASPSLLFQTHFLFQPQSEISESDSDENPLWMFSHFTVELLLAAMFSEDVAASTFPIGSYCQQFGKSIKQMEQNLRCFRARYWTKSNINL